MLHFHGVCLLVALASLAAAQNYTLFRPDGYSSLTAFDTGRGPSPLDMVYHLTRARVESDSCEGLNDVLAVTLAAPVVGEIAPADFSMLVCPLSGPSSQYANGGRIWRSAYEGCEFVTPTCARLQLEGEPAERRTVLLFGQFVQFEGEIATYAINSVTVYSMRFLVDGKQTEVYGDYTPGQGFGRCVLPPLLF